MQSNNFLDALNKYERKLNMDSNFESALKTVLEFEGGYVDNPMDNGGATNKGITQLTYNKAVKLITDDEIKEIYKKNYWLAGNCNKLPSILDSLHFDSCVNLGCFQANKLLQRSIGVVSDGVIGPQTLSTLARLDNKQVLTDYIKLRIIFYTNLAVKDHTQLVFMIGWVTRTLSFIKGAI